MVHRRTVIAIVALLTLAFLTSFYVDSLAASFLGNRTPRDRDEWIAPSRLDGSMLSVNGDPDELSTGFKAGSDGTLRGDDWVHIYGWDYEPGSGGVSSTVVSIILCWLQVGEIEQIN
jgi:heme A synthase